MIFITKSRGIAGNHQARETKFHQRINMEARQGHNPSPRDGWWKISQSHMSCTYYIYIYNYMIIYTIYFNIYLYIYIITYIYIDIHGYTYGVKTTKWDAHPRRNRRESPGSMLFLALSWRIWCFPMDDIHFSALWPLPEDSQKQGVYLVGHDRCLTWWFIASPPSKKKPLNTQKWWCQVVIPRL